MNLAELRESIERIAPRSLVSTSLPEPPAGKDPSSALPALPALPASNYVSTGFRPLDRCLKYGGFPRGHITELSGSISSGKLSLALRSLQQLTNNGGLSAYIGRRGSFFPPAAAGMGISLESLIVVGIPPDAPYHSFSKAAEILARTKSVQAIIIDPPSKYSIVGKQADRIQRAAWCSRSAVISMSTQTGGTQVAAARLQIRPYKNQLRQRARCLRASVHKGGISQGLEVDLSFEQMRTDHRPGDLASPEQQGLSPGVIPNAAHSSLRSSLGGGNSPFFSGGEASPKY